MPILNANGAFALTSKEMAEKQNRENKWGASLLPLSILTGSRPVQRQAPDSKRAKKAKLEGKPKKEDFKLSKFKPFKGQNCGASVDQINELVDQCISDLENENFSFTEADKSKQLNYLAALICHKRDIEDGAGERDLSYNMLINFFMKYPDQGEVLVKLFAFTYGSLNDLNKISEIIAEELGKTKNSMADWPTSDLEERKKILNRMDKCLVDIYVSAFNDHKNQKKNAAKWAPRIGKHTDRISKLGQKLCYALYPPGVQENDSVSVKKKKQNQSQKLYREFLSLNNSGNLEQNMCSKNWSEIGKEDYLSKIPGKAMSKYRYAFLDEFKYGEKSGERRHTLDEERTLLRENLKALTTKALENPEQASKLIKGSKTMQPHELVREIYSNMRNPSYEVSPVHEAQWVAMREKIKEKGSLSDTIVMSDVSGSMSGIPMEVSIALGMMIAEVQEGAWANRVMTFSENPSWFALPRESFYDKTKDASLKEKVTALAGAPWGGSTNMEKAFDLVLEVAKANNIPNEMMPKQFIILTDMCWNTATRAYNYNSRSYNSEPQLKIYKKRFEDAGYDFPVIVLWTLRANDVTYQNESNDLGVINLAGFSIALLKSILEGSELDLTKMTACDMLLETLSKKRYDEVFDGIKEVSQEGSPFLEFEKWNFDDKKNYK